MGIFDASKEWVILFSAAKSDTGKAAQDLARYIGLLAGLQSTGMSAAARVPSAALKTPALLDAGGPAPPDTVPVVVLNSEGRDPQQNGFAWRAGPNRVEIYGESGRGLCNGIYSFLASLGISWPAPGQEKLPLPVKRGPAGLSPGSSQGFLLSNDSAYESSSYEENDSKFVSLRRFVPAGKKELKIILEKSEAFAAWAARRRYDALIIPLAIFASASKDRKLRELTGFAGEYGIGVEAGGRDLSSLLPRRFFFFHRDFFRMEEGKRKKKHHFCPTNPGTIRLIGRGILFRAAGEAKVFHLWPDKGAEETWCSCPSCRAFTPAEQNRIAVNTAADVLASINPCASLSLFERPGGGENIPLRQNIFRLEKLPEEKEIRRE